LEKAIIFDLDGTLWDTSKEIEFVWSKIAKDYNLEVKDNQIKNIMGLTKSEIIEYFFDNNLELGNQFITVCQNKENEYLSKFGGGIYKNTIETIKKLSKSYNLYIVSNCQSGYIETFLDYYNLGQYFRDYECSGNTGESKEYNIKLVIKRNNIVDAIYVGDTNKDYQAAKGNNIKFIWAKYGFGFCDNYYKYIEDISELCNNI